jgi:hypothetical protein
MRRIFPRLVRRQKKVKGMWRQTPGNRYCPPPPPDEKKGVMPDHKILMTGLGGNKPGQVKIQLMIQRIPDVAGKMCTALGDTGANFFTGHSPVCERSGVQRSPCFHSNLGSWVKEQKEIKSAV